jgi:two-component system chemotaxis sensor kinase CheA
MDESSDLVEEFLVEGHEIVDALDAELLALERDPSDPVLLAGVFRRVHTIKGACGFFGFSELERVTHAGESLLSLLRDRTLPWSPRIASTLLALADAIRLVLVTIERTGAEGDHRHDDLVETLSRLQAEPALPAETPREGTLLGQIMVQRGVVATDDVKLAAYEQQLGDPRHLGEILVDGGRASSEDVVTALREQEAHRSGLAASTVRVGVEALDGLVTMVSELVLARNQVLQDAGALADARLTRTVGRLDAITSELQQALLATRMQPVGTVWSRFPRVVRDVANATGKQARVEMVGAETEMDRTILEAIRDPLTHVVRNAVDHGIEAPQTRLAAGKPPEGRLLLRAWHEGGQVHMEMSDDGAGIDVEAVRRTAVSRGLLDAQAAASAGERELLRLVFAPGLSTARSVTNLSGRGVGMDVVKTAVERIGGEVDLHSERGVGTTLKVRVPLTLAIIPGLVVAQGAERFVLPQANLIELVRLVAGGSRMRGASADVKLVAGAPVLRLRGRLLPLVFLAGLLGSGAAAERAGTVAVLQAGDRRFGLVVGEVRDVEEIVVKPLGAGLSGVQLFSGATIMGDGRVALILDVSVLALRAGVLGAVLPPEDAAAGPDGAYELLLARVGDRRLAVPLAGVARLEELPAAACEWAGGQEVVRYRDGILPLLRARELLAPASAPTADGDLLHVVVLTAPWRTGLVVDAVLDVVRVEGRVHAEGRRPGVLGSVVLRDRVADLLDLDALRPDREALAAVGPG